MKQKLTLTRPFNRGMSLIEIMVAVLLISFSLLGLMSLQARAFQLSVDSEDSTRAALLASEITSIMVTRNTSVIPDTDAELLAWRARLADPTDAGLPNGRATITAVSATTARIRIEWQPPRAAVGADNRYETDAIIPFIPATSASAP